MTLSYYSKTAKFYRWYYNTEVMPRTRCSYFRKLIIPFITGLILLRLLGEPTKLTMDDMDLRRTGVFGFYFMGLGVSILLLTIAGMISHPFIYVDKATGLIEILILFGEFGYFICFIGIVAGIVVGVITLIKKIKWKRNKNNIDKEPDIIYEGIKGFFDKFCPIIEWKK